MRTRAGTFLWNTAGAELGGFQMTPRQYGAADLVIVHLLNSLESETVLHLHHSRFPQHPCYGSLGAIISCPLGFGWIRRLALAQGRWTRQDASYKLRLGGISLCSALLLWAPWKGTCLGWPLESPDKTSPKGYWSTCILVSKKQMFAVASHFVLGLFGIRHHYSNIGIMLRLSSFLILFGFRWGFFF